MRDAIKTAIQESISVPDHIRECAESCYSDLMYGPKRSLIPWGNLANYRDEDHCLSWGDESDDYYPELGDIIEETYTGRIGNALRAFIDDLPSECWVDTDCGAYMDREPDWQEFIECDESEIVDSWAVDMTEHDGMTGYWQEIDTSSIYHVDRREIVEALFGKTIAHEFR